MAGSTNVSALLKQLSSASLTLSEASNKLTEQIKEIEVSLASYNLGVVTWVELRRTREEIDPSVAYVYRVDSLGYSKKNGKWGLYVTSSIEEVEHYESWLLRDAPRDLRILAVDAIPKLLEAMVAKAKELATEVASKTDRARVLANSLRSKPKKGE
jgi:hypothetical protein